MRAEDHLLALLLHADVTLTADLVAQRLEPLRRMTAAARDRAVTTLTAWLDAHGDVGEAATRLHVHPQTVRYRLARLKESFAGRARRPRRAPRGRPRPARRGCGRDAGGGLIPAVMLRSA